MPLFDPQSLLPDEELAAEAAEALVAPAEGERRTDLDAARLWRSRDDGLLVRGVKPHSAEKSMLVSRSVDTVSSAMAGKWVSAISARTAAPHHETGCLSQWFGRPLRRL